MAKRTKAIVPTEVVSKDGATLTEKRPRGKPRKLLDEKLLYKLGQSMMTVDDIADAMECSRDTIERHYGGILRDARANRKHSLSQSMWKNALDKENVQMQIWLSKQHLGHKESASEQPQQVNFNVIVNEVPR